MVGPQTVSNESIIVSLLVLISGILALELGLSVAILEIFAGIVGANVFGLLVTPWIDLLSMFGLLGLMFFAGFETDLKLLRTCWRESLFIGVCSFFIPLAGIALVAHLLIGVSPSVALLLGTGLSTTSLALVYAIFKERQILSSRHGQILLSSAMVVDVLSMLFLALFFEGLTFEALGFLSLSIGFIALLPEVGKWFFRRYKTNQIEFQIRFILLILLSLLMASSRARIHVSILAFITGVFFSEVVEDQPSLEEKLKSIIFGLMGPIFFFKAGLSIHLGNVSNMSLLYFLTLALLAYSLKYLSTFFATRRYFPFPIARFASLVFNFRLSFGIIIATFGLESRILSEDMYLGLMLSILFASIVSSIGLRMLPKEN